jgi:hypothetical protein
MLTYGAHSWDPGTSSLSAIWLPLGENSGDRPDPKSVRPDPSGWMVQVDVEAPHV